MNRWNEHKIVFSQGKFNILIVSHLSLDIGFV
jgi:hypothetical protein